VADITAQLTVDTADQAVALVVQTISQALITEGFLRTITIGSISLETYFGSWALVADYSNEDETFELIVVALQEIPDQTVSPSSMINAAALNIVCAQLGSNPPNDTPSSVADAWEATAPLALTLAMAAAYGVTPTITGPYRKADPTGEIITDTVIAVIELQACFITITLAGRVYLAIEPDVLAPLVGPPVQNRSTFVATMDGGMQQLVAAVNEITNQDMTFSINQGAAAFSVKAKVSAP